LVRRILFLPGAGGDPDFWKPLGDMLPFSWDKVYFEWPGLGNRAPHPEINRFEDLAGLVEKQLGDSPVDLFAQSMGGLIGARIAITHPGEVRRLVLSGTTAGALSAADYGANDWRPDYRRDYPSAAPWISDKNLAFGNDPRLITQPTLLLWSNADMICPVPVGEKLRALIPDSRLFIVHGGDHCFVRDMPGQIIEAVLRHLG